MQPPRDELLRTLSDDGSVSVRALVATGLVREAARRHGTSPTATVALGRALMGGLLLASEAQDGERVQLQADTNGDGRADVIQTFEGGQVARHDEDQDFDGRIDASFVGGKPAPVDGAPALSPGPLGKLECGALDPFWKQR